MWRHITGVEQPVKKIKLDNNEKLERKRTYDQVKRKRKFQTSWQKTACLHMTFQVMTLLMPSIFGI
jgi:hypothetical protein